MKKHARCYIPGIISQLKRIQASVMIRKLESRIFHHNYQLWKSILSALIKNSASSRNALPIQEFTSACPCSIIMLIWIDHLHLYLTKRHSFSSSCEFIPLHSYTLFKSKFLKAFLFWSIEIPWTYHSSNINF